MRKLFYFHGLESKQGGQKVDLLSSLFFVHAPQMNYKEPITWQSTFQKVQKNRPQIIIGSSMGGLMGFFAGYKQNIKMLLFNPAFDRIPEYIDGWKCNSSQQSAEIEIVLGRHDKDVDPLKTISYIEQNKIKASVTWLEIEHRIPFEVFVDQLNRFRKKYDIC